jgi:hypothetical protein
MLESLWTCQFHDEVRQDLALDSVARLEVQLELPANDSTLLVSRRMGGGYPGAIP